MLFCKMIPIVLKSNLYIKKGFQLVRNLQSGVSKSRTNNFAINVGIGSNVRVPLNFILKLSV